LKSQFYLEDPLLLSRMYQKLFDACRHNDVRMVREILRYDLGAPNGKNENGATALHVACYFGNLEVVKMMLAHDSVDPSPHSEGGETPFYWACTKGHAKVASFLKAYFHDPIRVREELQHNLVDLTRAEEAFAVVVLLSDGYLRARQAVFSQSKARRFFRIAKTLPMELQMVLCHRAFGSMKDIITAKHAEEAFKEVLAWGL